MGSVVRLETTPTQIKVLPERARVTTPNSSDGNVCGSERPKVTPDVGEAVLPDTGSDHIHMASAMDSRED